MEIDEEDIAIFQLSTVGVIYKGPFGEIKLSCDVQKLINGKDKILVDEKKFSLAVQRYKTQFKRYFGWDILLRAMEHIMITTLLQYYHTGDLL